MLGNLSDALSHLNRGESGLLNDSAKNIKRCLSKLLLKLSGKGQVVSASEQTAESNWVKFNRE